MKRLAAFLLAAGLALPLEAQETREAVEGQAPLEVDQGGAAGETGRDPADLAGSGAHEPETNGPETSPTFGPLLAPPQALIVTLNQERLFQESIWGRMILQRFDLERQALLAENTEMEAALEAEERALTERRAALSVDEFGALAAEFDRRVEQIRADQDAKSRALTQRRDEEQQGFFKVALPVLTELMSETGAVAILADGAVILSLASVDITDLAVLRMNEQVPLPKPSPQVTPEVLPQPDPPAAP